VFSQGELTAPKTKEVSHGNGEHQGQFIRYQVLQTVVLMSCHRISGGGPRRSSHSSGVISNSRTRVGSSDEVNNVTGDTNGDNIGGASVQLVERGSIGEAPVVPNLQTVV